MLSYTTDASCEFRLVGHLCDGNKIYDVTLCVLCGLLVLRLMVKSTFYDIKAYFDA